MSTRHDCDLAGRLVVCCLVAALGEIGEAVERGKKVGAAIGEKGLDVGREGGPEVGGEAGGDT